MTTSTILLWSLQSTRAGSTILGSTIEILIFYNSRSGINKYITWLTMIQLPLLCWWWCTWMSFLHFLQLNRKCGIKALVQEELLLLLVLFCDRIGECHQLTRWILCATYGVCKFRIPRVDFCTQIFIVLCYAKQITLITSSHLPAAVADGFKLMASRRF